jgi:hypothetical protein
VFDALAHSELEWAAADRNKFYWVGTLIVTGFFLVLAPIGILGYLLGVRPRFSNSADLPGSEFIKREQD